MNKKLQLIREKCIAANPHRKEGWDWDSGRPEGSGYMDHAPCRLADVLLAIETSEGKVYDRAVNESMATALNIWNLRADDLEKQSEDTITFLAELLSPASE